MPAGAAPRVALAPAGTRGWLADAITAGGGAVVDLDDANALVWTDPKDADGLAAALAAAPHVRWVQLPFAGVEPFVAVLDGERLWTCGKGVYAARWPSTRWRCCSPGCATSAPTAGPRRGRRRPARTSSEGVS